MCLPIWVEWPQEGCWLERWYSSDCTEVVRTLTWTTKSGPLESSQASSRSNFRIIILKPNVQFTPKYKCWIVDFIGSYIHTNDDTHIFRESDWNSTRFANCTSDWFSFVLSSDPKPLPYTGMLLDKCLYLVSVTASDTWSAYHRQTNGAGSPVHVLHRFIAGHPGELFFVHENEYPLLAWTIPDNGNLMECEMINFTSATTTRITEDKRRKIGMNGVLPSHCHMLRWW